jgi:hypothetical protein
MFDERDFSTISTRRWNGTQLQPNASVEAAGGGVYSLNGEPLRCGKPGLKNPPIMTIGNSQFDWLSLISNL